jgi:regulator of RNase E activity RraA
MSARVEGLGIEWKNDDEMLSLVRKELYTAVVGDICDQVGLRGQFLPPEVRPLDSTKKTIIAGRAMTVAEEDVTEAPDRDQPWGKMLEALDNLATNDVYVCSGSVTPYALFGELMSTAAMKRGAVGAVCNGFVRDTHQVLALGFPVYCRGSYALDQRGRGIVRKYRAPLQFGDVLIRPSDLIVGDVDGVIVVPKERESEVIVRALAKVRTESEVRKQLGQGMLVAEAFARYGVL